MQPGYHAHEDLFLRLLVGVGHTAMRTESVLGDVEIAGSLAFSQASVQDEDGVSTGETDIGVGLHALVGKEWWVSPTWGLGIAGQLFVGSMKDNAEGDDAPTWRTVALGLLLSATYD